MDFKDLLPSPLLLLLCPLLPGQLPIWPLMSFLCRCVGKHYVQVKVWLSFLSVLSSTAGPAQRGKWEAPEGVVAQAERLIEDGEPLGSAATALCLGTP